jgi:hypothetical protein
MGLSSKLGGGPLHPRHAPSLPSGHATVEGPVSTSPSGLPELRLPRAFALISHGPPGGGASAFANGPPPPESLRMIVEVWSKTFYEVPAQEQDVRVKTSI